MSNQQKIEPIKESYEYVIKKFNENPKEYIIAEILYSLVICDEISEKIQLLNLLINLLAIDKQVGN